MPSFISSSTCSIILLSILSLFESTKAQTGLLGARLICSNELELKITCSGACDIPPATSPVIDLNYNLEIKSKTSKAWQLTQAIVNAGSWEPAKQHEVLPLPQFRNIDNGEPLRLPYSIKSDELIGETPLLLAVVSAVTVGGGSCELDTPTIEILPPTFSRPSGNQDSQNPPSGGGDEPQSQPATSFPNTFTREITMFMNYEIGNFDRQPNAFHYEALVQETTTWMKDEIARLFNSNSRDLQGVSLTIDTAEYNQTEKFSQEIQFDVSITWGANALIDVPTTFEILQTSMDTSGFNTLSYRTNYLANLPVGNVFHNTMALSGSLSI